jgi:uncharacterized secreted protein with C-terminal beta-propeller domain
MKKNFYFLIFLLFFSLLTTGCSFPWSKQKVKQIDVPVESAFAPVVDGQAENGQMRKFADYQELKTFLEKQAQLKTFPDQMVPLDDSSKFNIGSDQPVDVSDQADIIKASGQYIYALVYNDIFIIKADQADKTQAVAKISFNSRPTEIYLHGGNLVVIGADEQIKQSSAYKNFQRQSSFTFLKIFDLSNPEAPKQIRDLDFEGSYRASRLISERLFLVLDNYSGYIDDVSIVPRLVDGGKILSSDCSVNNRCFAPDVYYFDELYNTYNFTSVNTLDLSNPLSAISSQSYLLNDNQNLYVSEKNIFITYSQYLNKNNLRLSIMRSLLESKLSESDKQIIVKINQTTPDVLTNEEKIEKTLQIFDNFLQTRSNDELSLLKIELNPALQKKYEEEGDNLERTIIHKFSLNGSKPVYRANSAVPGIILGESFLDENTAGSLRVMTIRNRPFGISAGEWALDTDFYLLGSDLKITGKLKNIAAEKKINNVFFSEQRAYLSFAESVDQLLALDFSDIQNPKLLGELKMPNFASYFYPYSETRLLAIGRDLQSDVYGNTVLGGLKLSLLDVSDLSLKEVDSYIAGASGSDSRVLYDSRSLLFKRDSNLLVVPTSLTSVASGFRSYFSGVLALTINNDKFSLLGQIDHSDGGKYQLLDSGCGLNCYDNSVRRSFYIKDVLYTFSNKYLKVNNLSDLKLLQAAKLNPDSDIDAQVQPLSGQETAVSSADSTVPVGSENSPLGPVLPSAAPEIEAGTDAGVVDQPAPSILP